MRSVRKECRWAVWVVFASIMFGACNKGTVSTQADEEAIRKVWSDFVVAWNMKNLSGMVGLWAEDGDYVNIQGRTASGRIALENLFADEQATIMKDSRMIMSVRSIRFIKPDLALVDGDMTVAGMVAPDSRLLVPQRINLASVMVKKEGKWMCQAARPTMPGDWAIK